MSDQVAVKHAEEEGRYDPADMANDRRVIYHLHGPYFFGAAAQLGSVLDRIAEHPRALVVNFEDVPMIDSSGARSFELLGKKTARKGGRLFLIGTRPEVRRVLLAQGAREPHVRYLPDLAAVDEVLDDLAAGARIKPD
jgi:SulP family sulfate permease